MKVPSSILLLCFCSGSTTWLQKLQMFCHSRSFPWIHGHGLKVISPPLPGNFKVTGLTEILLPRALINSKFFVEGKKCRPPLSWRAGIKGFGYEFSSRILTSPQALQRQWSYLEIGSALAPIINKTEKIISPLYHTFIQMLEENKAGGAESANSQGPQCEFL